VWGEFTLTLNSGDRVAKYAGEHVHEIVRKQESFEKEDYVKALQDGFVGTDTALLEGKRVARNNRKTDLFRPTLRGRAVWMYCYRRTHHG
jgi:hypothetical protein